MPLSMDWLNDGLNDWLKNMQIQWYLTAKFSLLLWFNLSLFLQSFTVPAMH